MSANTAKAEPANSSSPAGAAAISHPIQPKRTCSAAGSKPMIRKFVTMPVKKMGPRMVLPRIPAKAIAALPALVLE